MGWGEMCWSQDVGGTRWTGRVKTFNPFLPLRLQNLASLQTMEALIKS